MLGFSLYPHHLANGKDCSLESFAMMVAETASRYGVESIGIGSDLCQDQPDLSRHLDAQWPLGENDGLWGRLC